MSETVIRKTKLDDRWHEVKHLLSLEYDKKQIAQTMKVSVRTVERFLQKYWLGDFLQPGKRKEAERKKWAKKRMELHSPDNSARNEMITAMATTSYRALLQEGFRVEYCDVLSEVNLSYFKALKSYDDKRCDNFQSYFRIVVHSDVIDFKKSLGRRLKRQGYANVGLTPKELKERKDMPDSMVA